VRFLGPHLEQERTQKAVHGNWLTVESSRCSLRNFQR
jgi:hypothetical protein